MKSSYYQSQDLKKFKNISDWSPELGKKFFDYYNSVFEEGALTAREKSLIALAVAHTVQCPYCIDAYTQDGLQRGVDKAEMMEAGKASISAREEIVQPLLTIQQFALIQLQILRKSKEVDAEKIQILEAMVTRSLFGNINASRNSA